LDSSERFGKRIPDKFKTTPRVAFADIPDSKNASVLIRARVHATRAKGNQCFMVLRDRQSTLQALISVSPSTGVTKEMVKFAGSIKPESIVLVHGRVVDAHQPIRKCSIDSVELHVDQVRHIIPPGD
jgi:aspartyl-tRNA synthetase